MTPMSAVARRSLWAARRSPKTQWALSRLATDGERRSLEHGQVLEALQTANPPSRLTAAEFKVFSQFGEDGVLSCLTERLGLSAGRFVEIGVESYRECNTRYLASRVRSPWNGVAIDASDSHEHFLSARRSRWKLDVEPVTSFVTIENINRLLADAAASQPIDLLSLDIDGVDYWVWEAVEASPAIVVVEYNSVFGPDRSVTVPYDDAFDARQYVPGVYFGASLGALCSLGERKGYRFVGATSTGVNAFFVRNDLADKVGWSETSTSSWVDGRFANVGLRGESPASTRCRFDKLRLAADLALLDVASQASIAVGDLLQS
jgi:hypothetical protein